MRRYAIDSLNTTGLLIIKGGKIALKYGDIEEISYLASARKSILSMLYGKYVDNGVINLNVRLLSLETDSVGLRFEVQDNGIGRKASQEIQKRHHMLQKISLQV